jgi:general stress protein YciG
MSKKPKDPVREFLSRAGRKGGEAVLKKYGKRQLREWGKLGGRPPKKKSR